MNLGENITKAAIKGQIAIQELNTQHPNALKALLYGLMAVGVVHGAVGVAEMALGGIVNPGGWHGFADIQPILSAHPLPYSAVEVASPFIGTVLEVNGGLMAAMGGTEIVLAIDTARNVRSQEV